MAAAHSIYPMALPQRGMTTEKVRDDLAANSLCMVRPKAPIA